MSDLPPILLIAPLVALIAGGFYWLNPQARREPALRVVLILSVGITGIEALFGAFVVVLLILLSRSGGMENW